MQGVEKCANCSSEFHQMDKCDRAPACVSCGRASNHPSTSPACPMFLRKCEALDGHFPKNTMPYFPSREGWTWPASPTNPPQPQKMPTPQPQLANPNHHSIWLQHQKPCRKQVRFEDSPPPASQEQLRQTDEGWSMIRHHQLSPQRQWQATITDIWGSQQVSPPADNQLTEPPSHGPSQWTYTSQTSHRTLEYGSKMYTKSKTVQSYVLNTANLKDWDIIALQDPWFNSFGNTWGTQYWRVICPTNFYVEGRVHIRSILLVNTNISTDCYSILPIMHSDIMAARFRGDNVFLSMFNVYNEITNNDMLTCLDSFPRHERTPSLYQDPRHQRSEPSSLLQRVIMSKFEMTSMIRPPHLFHNCKGKEEAVASRNFMLVGTLQFTLDHCTYPNQWKAWIFSLNCPSVYLPYCWPFWVAISSANWLQEMSLQTHWWLVLRPAQCLGSFKVYINLDTMRLELEPLNLRHISWASWNDDMLLCIDPFIGLTVTHLRFISQDDLSQVLSYFPLLSICWADWHSASNWALPLMSHPNPAYLLDLKILLNCWWCSDLGQRVGWRHKDESTNRLSVFHVILHLSYIMQITPRCLPMFISFSAWQPPVRSSVPYCMMNRKHHRTCFLAVLSHMW